MSVIVNEIAPGVYQYSPDGVGWYMTREEAEARETHGPIEPIVQQAIERYIQLSPAEPETENVTTVTFSPETSWPPNLTCNNCGNRVPLNAAHRCWECHRVAVLRGAA